MEVGRGLGVRPHTPVLPPTKDKMKINYIYKYTIVFLFSVCLFMVTFLHMYTDVLSAQQLFLTSSLLTAVGYIVFCLVRPQDESEESSSCIKKRTC